MRLVKVKLMASAVVMTTISEQPLSEEALGAVSGAAAEIIADFPDYGLRENFIVSAGALPIEDILTEGWVYLRAEG